MSVTDIETLDNILALLDSLLDSDDITDEDWHDINDAFHTLENVRDNN